MRAHGGELLVGRRELRLRLCKLGTLGRNVEVDVVVDANVDNPIAQAGRRGRFALHVIVVELGVLGATAEALGDDAPIRELRGARVFNDLLLGVEPEVVLVVVLQRLEELGDVVHHLFRAAP